MFDKSEKLVKMKLKQSKEKLLSLNKDILDSSAVKILAILQDLLSEINSENIFEIYQFIHNNGFLVDEMLLSDLFFVFFQVSAVRFRCRDEFKQLVSIINDSIVDKEIFKIAIRSNIKAAEYFGSYNLMYDIHKLGLVEDFPFKEMDEVNQVALMIQDDDVESLKELMMNKEFNKNMRIHPYKHEMRDILLSGPNLIQYSALFGAEKCFKHLQSKKADLFTMIKSSKMTYSTLSYAVAGGNINIIMMLDIKDDQITDDLLKMSISFLRKDLYDWFTSLLKLRNDHIKSIFGSFFLHGMTNLQVEKNQFNSIALFNDFHFPINFLNSLLNTVYLEQKNPLMRILMNSIKHESEIFVDFILRNYQIDHQMIIDDKMLVEQAFSCDNKQILINIVRNPLIDFKAAANHSVSNKNFDFVEYLLDNNLISVNMIHENVSKERKSSQFEPLFTFLIRQRAPAQLLNKIMKNPNLDTTRKHLIYFEEKSYEVYFIFIIVLLWWHAKLALIWLKLF